MAPKITEEAGSVEGEGVDEGKENRLETEERRLKIEEEDLQDDIKLKSTLGKQKVVTESQKNLFGAILDIANTGT